MKEPQNLTQNIKEHNKDGKTTLAPVELKNGATEVISLVASVYISLQHLLQETKGASAFCELVSLCRDPEHDLQDIQKEYLIDTGLLQQNGTVHQSIKNVVLSAVEGEGLDMELASPVR